MAFKGRNRMTVAEQNRVSDLMGLIITEHKAGEELTDTYNHVVTHMRPDLAPGSEVMDSDEARTLNYAENCDEVRTYWKSLNRNNRGRSNGTAQDTVHAKTSSLQRNALGSKGYSVFSNATNRRA